MLRNNLLLLQAVTGIQSRSSGEVIRDEGKKRKRCQSPTSLVRIQELCHPLHKLVGWTKARMEELETNISHIVDELPTTDY